MVGLRSGRRSVSVYQHTIQKHGSLHGVVRTTVQPLIVFNYSSSCCYCVVRTVLVAICGFMPTRGGGAIGALDYTTEERQKLARK